MYQRILLAYDGTLEGRTALREGALLARVCRAEAHLLCVVPQNASVRMAEGAHGAAVSNWRGCHEAVFEEGLARLRELGFEPRARLVAGEPAREIAAYADEVGADLVVVGHRRQGLLERWWAGAAGAYLSDHLRCSLLVGRNDVTPQDFARELDEAGPRSATLPTEPPVPSLEQRSV